MISRSLITFLLALMPLGVWAQDLGWGRLSGGVESNSIWYVGGGIRSNNYVKLDYVRGRFGAGIQAEYYPSPLLGYDSNLKGLGLPGKYLSWTDTCWSITAGDFYDQFGTGVALRSWEDRALGWNNSLGGGRATFRTPNDLFSMRLLGGWRRKGLWYGADWLTGTELAFHFGDWDLQGSAVYKRRAVEDGMQTEYAWSALAAYAGHGFNALAEWVGVRGGNAQTLELGYAYGRFSSSLKVRRLQNMLDPMGMNYLPSLSQEQHYMLASLNPYTTFAAGELGGSLDLFYRLKTWIFHLSGTYIWTLPQALENHTVLRMGYREVNLDVEKRWTRRFKTTAFVSIQEYSPSHGERNGTDIQNVFVLDASVKVSREVTLRSQFQYLYSQELTRDWMAASLEMVTVSGWAVHVQDMYNHGDTKEHYYNVGGSWTRGGFKVDVSYGHQRAGLVCSGGVCRWQPEYTGGILRLSYNF